MALKISLVALIVGMMLIAVGWWLERPRELTLEQRVARLAGQGVAPEARHEALGPITFWSGAGLFAVGGTGLFLCGVRKGYLTGGACHD